MATKLKNLVITKVALVDEGSCSAAHIKLYKRKEGGSIMKFEDIMKALTPEQQAVVNAEIEKAKTACAEESKAALDKAAEDLKAAEDAKALAEQEKENAMSELNKMKQEANKSEEDILKNVDPAVRAILEKSRAQAAAAEAAVRKMKEEQDTAEAIAKAKELPNLGTGEEELSSVLKSLKATDEKLFNTVFGIMKSADAVIAKGAAFEEKGTSQEGNGNIQKAADAWAKIETAAAEIAKSRNITKEAAVSVVIEEQPDLYRSYLDAEMA